MFGFNNEENINVPPTPEAGVGAESETNTQSEGEVSNEVGAGEENSEATTEGVDTEEQNVEEEQTTEPVEEQATEAVDPAPVGYASALEKRVEFEGNVIEAVLHDGKETETLYHCKFTNGTTGHVPKEFLDKELAS